MASHSVPLRRRALCLCARVLALFVFTSAAGLSAAQEVEPVRQADRGRHALVAQAVAYEHGEGVRKDPQKAAELYCEAARDFDPEAQYRLGWMYANGRGIPRDDAAAVSMLELAAASGHIYAQKTLAMLAGVEGRAPDCMKARAFPELKWAAPNLAMLDEPDPFAGLPPWKQKIADVVGKLAPVYSVDPRLALSVIAVESNFNASARSEKNARGLMQLIPETAARFNVKDSYDVTDNVRGGLAYLRWLLAYYRGQVPLAAAAYNAGEGAVDRHRGIPPYPETREYVRRVMKLYRSEQHRYDPRIVGPSPLLTRAGTGPS